MKSNFEKTLMQLNSPYKKIPQKEMPKDRKKNDGKVSVFWDVDAGYEPKYVHVKKSKKQDEQDLGITL